MTSSTPGDATLVYRMPDSSRWLMMAGAVVMMAFLLSLAPSMLGARPDSAGRLAFGLLWLALAGGAVSLAMCARIAFFFDAEGVVSRRWWGSRSLAYADMAGCTVQPAMQMNGRGPIARGWRVTFLPAHPDDAPLALLVDERVPMDARIVARLRGVAALDERALKVLELATLARDERR